MMRAKVLMLAVAAAVAGCSQPGTYSAGQNPYQNTTTGAVAGAVVGGLAGAVKGGKGALGNTLAGAVIGGAVGAIAGGALDRQAADLRAGLGNENITVVNTGKELVVTMPQDILFATDSDTVSPPLLAQLAALARNLQAYPASAVTIVGHTDNTGGASHNQDLSQRRADAVAQVLMADGVAGARLIAFGRGESQPVATNLTPEGRAQNRRVEIHIAPTGNG